MKRFILTILIVMFIPMACFAQEYDKEKFNSTLEGYDLTSFDMLSNETKNLLDDLGISNFDYDNLINFSFKKILLHINDIIISKSETPLKLGLTIISFTIISAFITNFSNSIKIDDNIYSCVVAIVVTIFLVKNLSYVIALSASTIKLSSDFAFAFFPAFCIIAATTGNAIVAASVNSLLLTLSQGVGFFCDAFFVPLTKCFLSISVCAGLNKSLNLDNVVSVFKNLIIKLISTLSALFVSVLSLKTAVASKTDAIGLRSVRFAINSVVPVIGSSISEGLLSIQSYSSLIKTSVGMVGIIAIFSIFLPSLIEVTIWRGILSLCCICCEIFEDKNCASVLKAFGNTMLILNVMLILTMVTTIISIGILIATKSVV